MGSCRCLFMGEILIMCVSNRETLCVHMCGRVQVSEWETKLINIHGRLLDWVYVYVYMREQEVLRLPPKHIKTLERTKTCPKEWDNEI